MFVPLKSVAFPKKEQELAIPYGGLCELADDTARISLTASSPVSVTLTALLACVPTTRSASAIRCLKAAKRAESNGTKMNIGTGRNKTQNTIIPDTTANIPTRDLDVVLIARTSPD